MPRLAAFHLTRYNSLMAKVSYVLIPDGYESKYAGALAPGDRFTISRVRRKVLFSSRKRIAGLTAKSLLPQVSEAWAALSTGEKEDWTSAAAEMGLDGYKLYVQDKTIRLKNAISGDAVPSIYHQSWVGKMEISSPADQITIAQFHPESYWISKKVTGFDRREPVQVSEPLALPLTIGISWKSDLSIISGSEYVARFFAVVYSLYQGRTIENVLEIPFGLSDDWGRQEVTLSSVLGGLKGYTLFLETDNVLGTILFDNIKSYHTGQNWARDPACRDINQTFTRVYNQVPKHWAPVILPEGSFYDSVYPED